MSTTRTRPAGLGVEALDEARQAARTRQLDGDLEGALSDLETIVSQAPTFGRAMATGILVAKSLCHWEAADRLCEAALHLERRAPAGAAFPSIMPFTALGLDIDLTSHRLLAERHVRRFHPEAAPPRPPRDPSGRRLRLGYLSADIRHHPVMHLGAGLFDHHDRDRFEIFCFSTAPDDGSEVRRRVVDACEHFVDLVGVDTARARRAMAMADLDVVVDLSAHTEFARLDLLASRPAPLQLHYLGYPGTTGAPYIDAFVADAISAPRSTDDQFTEQVVRLPRCYQINEPLRRVRQRTTRRAHRLPDSAFVMGAFNSAYKIEPVIFAVWMRLLRRLPHAVLWLLVSNEQTAARLRTAVVREGVDPRRVVFAPPVERDSHLRRLALADVCLDTHFVGGHTTTSDALRSGTPVVTAPREPFISRVAASLLHEVGLQELIARDLADYEDIVVRLAADPGGRGRLRRRARSQIRESCLFDPGHATAALEQAVLELLRERWERHEKETVG